MSGFTLFVKHSVISFLLLLLAGFLGLAFISYNPNDPSWLHISSDMVAITNMAGASGAWLASVCFAFLGYAAWWLPVILCYETISLWLKNNQPAAYFRYPSFLFLILSFSGLLAVLTGKQPTGAGGIIGSELAWRLSAIITQVMAGVVWFAFSLLTLLYAFNVRWHAIVTALFGEQQPHEHRVDRSTDIGTTHHTKANQANLVDTTTSEKVNTVTGRQTDSTADLVTAAVSDTSVAPVTMSATELQKILHKGVATAQSKFENITNSSKSKSQTVTNPISKQEPTFDWQSKDVFADLLRVTAPQPLAHEQNITEDTAVTTEKSPLVAATQGASKRHAHVASDTVQTDGNKSSETSALLQQRYRMLNKTLARDNHQPEPPTIHPTDDIANTTKQHTGNQIETHDEDYGLSDSELNYYASLDLPPVNNQPETDWLALATEPTQQVSETGERLATGASVDNQHGTKEVAASPQLSTTTATMPSRAMQTAQHRQNLSPLPPLSLLDLPDPNRQPSYSNSELARLAELLEIKLQEFGVKSSVVKAQPGPVVTRFEVELAAGVKASKVTNISRDLARSLSMASVRVVEVIPGKPYIGIEVPNHKREMVRLIELLDTSAYQDPKGQISMAMGKDIAGKPVITDLAKAPHMLVAGTTGSGKSVLVNSMLLSMLLKYPPAQLRLILIDPKQLELANYNDIPHLLTPVVTDMTEAASSLSWCVAEMERRYKLMSLFKVRKLHEFNKKVLAAEASGEPILDPLWRPNDSVSVDKPPKLKTLPLIVIVADEFADMIMQVGKQAEELITRLAQKSRAAGIHLMLATQRPSVDVITGLIKANVPIRAALRVNSKVDSRTILDAGGAEDMLGNGDMLFLGPGKIEPERVHGAYVSDEEVNRVCDAWRERGAPDYIEDMLDGFEVASSSGGASSVGATGEEDPLYDEAVAFILETRKVSASSIQRKFSIGYNRAARIVDSMEEAGIVSGMGKGGKRDLLM